MSQSTPSDSSQPYQPVDPSQLPKPDEPPVDVSKLPKPIQDELNAPDPVAIDTESRELKDGLNRCPKCGSTDIELKVETQTLVCHFCRYEWSAALIDEKYRLSEGIGDLKGTVIATGAKAIAADAASIVTLKCQGCGAEVVVDTAHAMGARCHWCRSVLTINTQIPNGSVPDAVLPFHITHDDAVERIRQFAAKRRLFADSTFKKEFTPENVLGVYLPYMVVDANAAAELGGVGEVKTRQYTRRQGDNDVTYYDADVYEVRRHVEYTVDDLQIESSAERANIDPRLNTNNIINTILPFDVKNAVEWNAAYLTGYTSEKRDLDVEHITPQLEDQLLSIARSQALGTIGGYDRGVRWETEQLDLVGSRWVSMYLPVWLYSYYHPGKGRGLVHYIAVNGRTGETMGSIPVAQWKLLLAAVTTGTVIEGLVLAILVGLAW